MLDLNFLSCAPGIFNACIMIIKTFSTHNINAYNANIWTICNLNINFYSDIKCNSLLCINIKVKEPCGDAHTFDLMCTR